MDKRPERIQALADLWDITPFDVEQIIKWVESHIKVEWKQAQVLARLLRRKSEDSKPIPYKDK